ncbi:MAG: hypothetical protein HYX96_08680 [Chloroflexi bacterium]|nr:hypothetical protein [Chloroflexota bacterium]
MPVETFRDLMIGIVGAVFLVVMILVAILALLLYFKVKNLVNSVNVIVTRVQTFTVAAAPVIQIAAFIQGVRQGVKAVKDTFGKKEEGKHGRKSKG